jgi:hypothetical protein
MEKKLAQIFMLGKALGHGLFTGTTPMLSSLSPYSGRACGPRAYPPHYMQSFPSPTHFFNPSSIGRIINKVTHNFQRNLIFPHLLRHCENGKRKLSSIQSTSIS